MSNPKNHESLSGERYSAATQNRGLILEYGAENYVGGYDATSIVPRMVLRGEAVQVRSPKQLKCIGPIGSRNDWLSAFFVSATEIIVTTGCFTGTLEEFEAELNVSAFIGLDGTVRDRNKRDYLRAIDFIKACAQEFAV